MLTRAGIQRLRSLCEPRGRREAGLLRVEGAKLVEDLVVGSQSVVEIYATAEWRGLESFAEHFARSGIRLEIISATDMARISELPTPSPVLAVLKRPALETPPGVILSGVTLALDGIQDPGNIGTLIRLADWFGLDRVLLSDACADPHGAKALHASMGSFSRVPLHRGPLADWLAQARVPVLGCDLEGDPLPKVSIAPPWIVVVGSEGRGMSPGVKASLTRRLTIPRLGGAESLNAAVAGGIVLASLRLPRG